MFLTSDIPSYDLPGLGVKILDNPQNRRILDEDTGTIYDELEQTLKYMLQNPHTKLYRNEEKFEGAEKNTLHTLQKPPMGTKWNLWVLSLVFSQLFLYYFVLVRGE